MNYRLKYDKKSGLFAVVYWSVDYWRMCVGGWSSKEVALENLFYRLKAEEKFKNRKE